MSEDNMTMHGYDDRIVPWIVLEDELIDVYLPKIGAGPFALYVVLIRFAKKGQQCPSQKVLAQIMGIKDAKTIRNYLDILSDNGLIVVLPRFVSNLQTSNEYRVRNASSVGKNSLPISPSAAREKFPTDNNNNSIENEEKRDPVIAMWEEESRQVITKTVADRLVELVAEHGESEVMEAIKKAVLTVGVGKFSLNYVTRILKGDRKKDDDHFYVDPNEDYLREMFK